MSEQEPKYNSREFDTLGKRFTRICDSYGLEPEHVKLIDDVLSGFEGRLADIGPKLQALTERIADNPQSEDIAAAFVEISHQYVERHPISPMGRFARKAGLN